MMGTLRFAHPTWIWFFLKISLVILPLFMRKTPEPLFPHLSRDDQRMARLLKMPTRVLMLRRIAAQHLATALTDAEMNPLTTDTDTLLATEDRIVRFGNQVFQLNRIQILTAHSNDGWRMASVYQTKFRLTSGSR
jgi:hypothetical protein